MGRRHPRQVPFVPQVEIADCGAASLASALAFHGTPVALRTLRTLTQSGRDGASARNLVGAARALGFTARGVRVEPAALASLPRGTILHCTDAHFLVLDRVGRAEVRVIDPMFGPRWLAPKELAERASGVAILVEPGSGDIASAELERPRRVLRLLLDLLRAQRRRLLLLALVSAAIQSFVFLTPVTIAVAMRFDSRHRPTGPMLVAFAAGACLCAFTGLRLRGIMLARLRVRLDDTLVRRFVDKTTELPLTFFETRTTGDLLGRVNSTAAVRDAVSNAAVTSLIDGVSALLVVAGLVVVSPPAAGIAAALIAVLVATTAVTATAYRTSITETQSARVRSQGDLASLVWNIEQIKAQGVEDHVAALWQRHFADELRFTERSTRLAQRVSVAGDTVKLTGPTALLCIVLAVSPFTDVRSLLPLVVAVSTCLAPVTSLANTALTLIAARIHLLRLIDVYDEPADSAAELPVLELTAPPTVELRDVSYAYPGSRRDALAPTSVVFEPGRFTVLVGPSGSGKTTALKLVLGLVSPRTGEVSIDGIPLATVNTRALRSRIGVVTQQVGLTAGTIEDNILVGRARDEELLRQALARSCAEEFVRTLPLGLGTPLSDRGASLSGGQRQRIALARALYGNPVLLVLDEATSQLDPQTEERVVDALVATGATILFVSHRAVGLRRADRIVMFGNGEIVRAGSRSDLLLDPLYDPFWAAEQPQPAGTP